MATANFHARIQRIQKSHQNMPVATTTSVREPGIAAIAATRQSRRRRSPLRDHLVSLLLGLVLGGLAAVLQIGHQMEGAPWGPGGDWNDLAFYPIVGCLALAPLLILLSLFLVNRRPGFALFSLGYLSGVVVPLFI